MELIAYILVWIVVAYCALMFVVVVIEVLYDLVTGGNSYTDGGIKRACKWQERKRRKICVKFRGNSRI